MDYSEIVSISGMSGLFKVVSTRPDGMIVSPLDEDKPKFVSARIHMFTPLENITIYTVDDSMELKEVFRKMKKAESEASPVEAKADSDTLKAYFEKIIPDYDKDKVYVSDIKKVLKWFKELNAHNLIPLEDEKQDASENVDVAAAEEAPHEKATEDTAKED